MNPAYLLEAILLDIIRYFTKYFWVVFILLITILSFSLSKTVIFFTNRSLVVPPAKEAEVKTVNKETSKIRRPFEDYKIIFERNLFNISAKEQVTQKRGKEILKNPAEIPISTSGMELIGTFVGSPKTSTALIKADGEVDAYHTGETVKGATILNINRREVIIDNNGSIEKLVMEELSKSVNVAAPQASPPAAPVDLSGIQQVASNKWVIDRKKVPIKNINTFMRQCRLIPHSVLGRPAGFKITGIIKGSIIDKIGLIDGDIIKRVNNDEIKMPDDVYRAYQSLQSENRIVLDIERNGAVTPLSYEVKN